MTGHCPICNSTFVEDSNFENYDARKFDCEVCGSFALSRTVLVDRKLAEIAELPVKRAALSHRIRQKFDANNQIEMWTTDKIDQFLESGASLPRPAQQALNIIRFLGEYSDKTGGSLKKLPRSFHAIVGAANRTAAMKLLFELKGRGLLRAVDTTTQDGFNAGEVELTLSGWELFESERQGNSSGQYGFVALKFGDDVLDPLLRDHIKPYLLNEGYEVLDMRDVARAGVIDNLLRIQIRDSLFVIVDLTHENAGAYWEAGYAEGLGKPVLYICERSKFDEKKTHFDTNHCTTVLWDADDPSSFLDDLGATLKRSLD